MENWKEYPVNWYSHALSAPQITMDAQITGKWDKFHRICGRGGVNTEQTKRQDTASNFQNVRRTIVNDNKQGSVQAASEWIKLTWSFFAHSAASIGWHLLQAKFRMLTSQVNLWKTLSSCSTWSSRLLLVPSLLAKEIMLNGTKRCE